MTLPAEIKTFAQLVVWLIENVHEGNRSAMARKLKVSVGLVWQWREGLVKQPSLESVDRMVRAYKLDYWAVMALVLQRRLPHPIGGGSSDDGTPTLANPAEILSLIRRYVYQWLRGWWPVPTAWCPA